MAFTGLPATSTGLPSASGTISFWCHPSTHTAYSQPLPFASDALRPSSSRRAPVPAPGSTSMYTSKVCTERPMPEFHGFAMGPATVNWSTRFWSFCDTEKRSMSNTPFSNTVSVG